MRGFLGLPVTEQEYHAWVTDPADSQRKRGKHRRYREHVVSCGSDMTRLSFLAGKTQFNGLIPSTMGSGIWILEVVNGRINS